MPIHLIPMPDDYYEDDLQMIRLMEELESDSDTSFDSESDTTSESDSEEESEWETASDPEDVDMDAPKSDTSDWTDEVRTANVCEFKLQPGLKVAPQGKTPVDFFNLLFTEPLFEFLVKNVNEQGKKMFEGRNHSCRYVKQWKEVTMEEFYKFLGLLFYMGTINTAKIEDHWNEDLFYIPQLEDHMSRERWSCILRCLNFSDNTGTGRISKVSYIRKYFNDIMKTVVVPEKILCIDMSSVNVTLLRTMFQERLFLLGDRSGLVHNLQIYRGLRELFENFDTDKVVKLLLEDRLDVGHSIYMDEYFNSVKLAKFLVSRNTHLTGPLDRKTKGTPIEVEGERLEKDQKITKYNPEGVGVTKWRFRHKLLMISTEHSGEWQEHDDKRKGCTRAPVCAVEYEKNYDGIEKHDEMMSYYNCEDITRLWHKRLGIRVLQMLLLNAHNMYNRYGENTEKEMLWEDFRKNVITDLLTRTGQAQ